MAVEPYLEPHCWACSIWPPAKGNDRHLDWRLYAYENLVELAEEMGTFSISSLWRAGGKGPTLYGIARNVVHDMRKHGLIVCVKSRKNGICDLWAFRRPRDQLSWAQACSRDIQLEASTQMRRLDPEKKKEIADNMLADATIAVLRDWGYTDEDILSQHVRQDTMNDAKKTAEAVIGVVLSHLEDAIGRQRS